MTVTHLYVRCTRCGARAFLSTITPAMLQHEPTAAHEPDDPTRQELDRWLLDVHFVNPSPVFCLDKTRR